MLDIRHLKKHYKGGTRGVSDVTLHVAPGELYAFIGPNGAGKTTALKCIAGIHDYDAGEIRIDGIDLRENPMECKRRIAYIPDNPDLFDYLTGMQYLNFIADVFGVPAGERRARIERYAGDFELTGALGDLIGAYSHGMKQKLAIVSALIHSPRLLILDEPFVGLDPKAALTLKEAMRGICRAGGAIFFSTHVLDVAERLCSRVAILREGVIVAEGSMDEILAKGQTLESDFMEVAADANAD